MDLFPSASPDIISILCFTYYRRWGALPRCPPLFRKGELTPLSCWECKLLTADSWAALQKLLYSFPIQWQLEVWCKGPAPLPQLRNGWSATPTSELPKDWLGNSVILIGRLLLPLPKPDPFTPCKGCSTTHSPKQLSEHKSQFQSLFPRETNSIWLFQTSCPLADSL